MDTGNLSDKEKREPYSAAEFISIWDFRDYKIDLSMKENMALQVEDVAQWMWNEVKVWIDAKMLTVVVIGPEVEKDVADKDFPLRGLVTDSFKMYDPEHVQALRDELQACVKLCDDKLKEYEQVD